MPRSERRRALLAALGACLLIVLAAGLQIFQSRASVRAGVEAKTLNLAVSVVQTVDGLIDMIDVALLVSADEISRQNVRAHPDPSAISDYLTLQASRLPHVAYLRGTDANGQVVYGPGIPISQVNLSDREFFKQLRDNPGAGLFMAKPVVAKITGKSVVTFARRIQRADGAFAGTVYASIDLDELTTMLAHIEMPTGASIALRDDAMALVARHVFGAKNPIPVGDTRLSKPFADALRIQTTTGTYLSDASGVDPDARIYAYRRSTRYPYLANVGSLVYTEFADWRKQSILVISMATLLCLGMILFAQQSLRARVRREAHLEEIARNHAQLQLQEQSHRLLLRDLNTGLLVHGPDGQMLFANALACRLFGLTSEQLLGKVGVIAKLPFVDTAGQPVAIEDLPLYRVLKTRTAVENQMYGVTPHGSTQTVWLEGSGFPEFHENGALKQVVVSFNDVSLRRQAEQAQVRVARALRLLSDSNMAIASCITKEALFHDICELICSKGGYLMAWVGYAMDDPHQSVVPVARAGIDTDYLDSVAISWSADAPTGQGPTGQSIRTGQVQINHDFASSVAMEPWRAAALTHGFQSSISIPFTKQSGKRDALMIYASQSDAFNDEEVELLKELTINLAHGLDAIDDRQRRVEAESASQAKAAFLANMSHEIRTPLNAITGMAYLIRKEGLSASQMERMGKLETAGRHLLGILTDILDLSKIDANKLVLEAAPLRADAIVSNVLSMLQDRAQAKQIQLGSEVDAVPLNLIGDATRLQQALLNFGSNAVKFTAAGRVTLRVKLVEKGVDAVLLRFEVSDTGIGIAPQTLRRLFTPFEQADNSTTREFGGTGLGLTITKRLAQLMGGDAGAHSVPGAGSTFWFTARLQRSQVADATLLAGDGEEAFALLKAAYTGVRVLVVEDEPINCEIARYLLEDAGLVVDTAADGVEALERAGQARYQLILMDMRMPRMNGLDATRAIRQLPGYAATPILATTANAFAEDRKLCEDAGMNGFLAKPAPPAVFYTAVLDILSAD